MGDLHHQDAVVDVGRGPSTLLRARHQLAALAEEVDVVHAHGLTAGWVALLTPRCRPLVLTVHNLVMHEIAGPRALVDRRLESVLCQRVDAVIATSTDMAADLRRRAPRTPVDAVPPLSDPAVARVSPQHVRTELGISQDARLVVAAARLHPQKDLDTFLHAVEGARSRVPGLRAALVGAGPLAEDIRRRRDDMGLSDVVVLCGSRDDAPDLIAAADVLVVSSRWESGPLVVREALELGTPVVSTRVGFVPEVLADSPVPPVPVGDGAGLASGIVAVLESTDVAADVVEAGRRGVARVLDPARLVDDVERVYRRVLGAGA